jgi:hypothetical protein
MPSQISIRVSFFEYTSTVAGMKKEHDFENFGLSVGNCLNFSKEQSNKPFD